MDPLNHEKMVKLRQEKVDRVANYIPELSIDGDDKSDLLVVGWGGTYGVILTAIEELREEGKKISLAQFKHIMPLPKNTEKVFSKFKKILVCENNMGQFVNYLKMNFPQYEYLQYNKIQGLPFKVSELKDHFISILNK